MELTPLQYHLFQNPLYKFVDKAERSLNLVFIGFDEGAQKFLDLCLQVMQCRSEHFTTTVFCADEPALDYLYTRPELEHFFSIDGHAAPDSYGSIFFKPPAEPEEILSGVKANYIFVDTGEDAANKATAVACRKILKDLNREACVSFVWRGAEEHFPKKIVPVFVNDKVEDSGFRRELERMAFNVHLVWEKNLNVARRELKKNFLKPYYHEACLAAVLAIKYKLDDFGVDNENPLMAARNFSKLLFTPKARNEFIFAEHKRWVTEKICKGWQRRPIEDCADGVTKDERRKSHVCLVRSRPVGRLEDKFKPEDWLTLTKADLRELDELDAVSVKLHKLFAEQAQRAKSEPDILANLVDNISATLAVNPKVLMCFNELKVCFQEIFNGDGTKLRLYKNLSDTFRQNLRLLPAEKAKAVAENFAVFEEKTRSIRLALECHDYKNDDAAMVENIPFILTYSERTCLLVPLASGRTTDVFGNVAAATIINPLKIIYAVFCATVAELERLKDCVPKLLDYMTRKNLRAELEFLIACAEPTADFEQESIQLKAFAPKKITDVRFVRITNAANPAPEVIQAFQKFFLKQARKRAYDLTALEVNDTTVSNWLQGGGVCTQIPAYRFDSAAMKFTSINQCDSFGYIRKKNFITVNDLTALNHSFGNIGEQPTFLEDYKDLWAKYQASGWLWKKLCTLLKSHATDNDLLATFSSVQKANDKYRYILPAFCFKATEVILQELISKSIAARTSRVRPLNANACEVIIIDPCANKAAYDKLFANPYRLMHFEAITFTPLPQKQKLSIFSDNLIVEGLNLSAETKESELIKLLEFFRDKNYLTGLVTANAANISFTYATREIKSLLTKEGKLTEVYVYREAKNRGDFDDVVANFEPYWNAPSVHNEFDCVLTKNFRVLLVECKATNDIKQDVYFKLSGLAEKFGVNARAILVVADNRVLADEIKKRGDELGIITLQENLENIGKILSDMI